MCKFTPHFRTGKVLTMKPMKVYALMSMGGRVLALYRTETAAKAALTSPLQFVQAMDVL